MSISSTARKLNASQRAFLRMVGRELARRRDLRAALSDDADAPVARSDEGDAASGRPVPPGRDVRRNRPGQADRAGPDGPPSGPDERQPLKRGPVILGPFQFALADSAKRRHAKKHHIFRLWPYT